jgi:hypothetical protein
MNMTSWDIISSRSNYKEGISAKTAYLCKEPIFAEDGTDGTSSQGRHLCKDGTSPQRHHLQKDAIPTNVDLHLIGTMMN